MKKTAKGKVGRAGVPLAVERRLNNGLTHSLKEGRKKEKERRKGWKRSMFGIPIRSRGDGASQCVYAVLDSRKGSTTYARVPQTVMVGMVSNMSMV